MAVVHSLCLRMRYGYGTEEDQLSSEVHSTALTLYVRLGLWAVSQSPTTIKYRQGRGKGNQQCSSFQRGAGGQPACLPTKLVVRGCCANPAKPCCCSKAAHQWPATVVKVATLERPIMLSQPAAFVVQPDAHCMETRQQARGVHGMPLGSWRSAPCSPRAAVQARKPSLGLGAPWRGRRRGTAARREGRGLGRCTCLPRPRRTWNERGENERG